MEQTSSTSSDTVSSQKSLPPSHDPGWNDPPEWAFSSLRGSCAASNKRLLNKRVAFPLFSQGPTTETANRSPPSNMPPVSSSSLQITTAPHRPLVTPTDSNTAARPVEGNFDKDLALTQVTANLESVITDEGIEKNKAQEIRKRLGAMKSDWLEDKFDDTVRKRILDISEALSKRDVEQADKFHIDLAMQHATVCRTWIPAIRHIISELKKEHEDCNISGSEQSQSPLLPVAAQMQDE